MSETRDKVSFCGFLGIDISKRTFDGCCIDSEGKVLFRVSLPMNSAGFEKLLRGALNRLHINGLHSGPFCLENSA
jgi:transposase